MKDTVSAIDLLVTTAVHLALCFGLRESSVPTMQSNKLHVDMSQMSIRMTFIKGKNTSRQHDLEYHRVGTFSSAIELLLHRNQARRPRGAG